MTNLPINANTPKPANGSSTNGSNSPQQANSNNADSEVSPFANVLSRQMGESSPTTANTAQAVSAEVDATAKLSKDIKNSKDTPAVSPDGNGVIAIAPDSTNPLAATALSIPVEARAKLAQEGFSNVPGKQQDARINLAALTTASKTTAKQAADTAQELPLAAHAKTTAKPAELVSATGIDKKAATVASSQLVPKHGELTTPQQISDKHNYPASNLHASIPTATFGNTVTGSSGNNTLTVQTPLNHAGWANDFSQQIVWLGSQKNQTAELHLNPPNLGPLDIALTITDKHATIQFSSPHGMVRDAVENALPKLREIFADNGIMLGNTTVSDQAPRDRNPSEFMGQSSNSGAQRDTVEGITPEQAGTSREATVVARRHIGMVDTFA